MINCQKTGQTRPERSESLRAHGISCADTLYPTFECNEKKVGDAESAGSPSPGYDIIRKSEELSPGTLQYLREMVDFLPNTKDAGYCRSIELMVEDFEGASLVMASDWSQPSGFFTQADIQILKEVSARWKAENRYTYNMRRKRESSHLKTGSAQAKKLYTGQQLHSSVRRLQRQLQLCSDSYLTTTGAKRQLQLQPLLQSNF